MVYSEKPYPDLEAGVIEWASQNIPGLVSSDQARFRYKHVGDELPSHYSGRLPFMEIQVREGEEDGITWMPSVDISIYAESRAQAWDISGQVFARMGVYPRRFGSVSAHAVEVTAWPTRSRRLEPDDSTVCFSGELSVTVRR